jgi:hypothetical protein
MKLSYEQIREKLNKLLFSIYILEMYDDHVICEKDSGGYCSIAYTVADDGSVTISEPVDVQRQYVPVTAQAAMTLTAASGKSGDADYGFKWRVQVIKYGLGLDGRINWPREPLVAALDKFQGARVFALTDTQHRQDGNKSVREIVGWLDKPADSGTAIEADFEVLKAASWLRDMAVDSFERGKPDLIGFSVDIGALTTKKLIAGKQVLEPVKISGVEVDVVYNPTNDGKFLRMAAAAQAGQKEEDMLEKLLAALKAQRADLYATIEAKVNDKSITEDEVMKLLASAMQKQSDMDGFVEKLKAVMQDDKGALAEAQKVLDQARLVACGFTLDAELKASGLPDLSQARVKKLFAGQVFETDKLTAAIKDEKEYIDKLTGSGIPQGTGDIRDMQTEPERLQAAFDKLLGVEVDAKFKDVPPIESLRAGYVRITGDMRMTGQISPDRVKLGEALMQFMKLPAAYASNSFTYVLGNSMYRRLLREYRAVDYKEDILFSFIRNAADFKTMEIIQIGYFGDLPDVDPESGDYQEVSMPTDIEATYSINQKGVILTITRKVIYNDDLKSVSQLISKLGRAAKRTHARRAWDKIISNATFKGDNKALFHNDHANLGATALTNDATGVAALTARLQAMYAQTEQDSAEILGLIAMYLWCPRALYEIAMGLNSPWPGIAGGNPHAGRFGANHERIITIPLFTDATDWGLIADKNDVELLEAAYLNGNREPELFVADNPLVGQMFVADKIQYKERHEYEFEIADTKGFDKSVVAG